MLTSLLSLNTPFAFRKGAIAALDVPDSGNRIRAGFVWLLAGERRIVDPAMLVP